MKQVKYFDIYSKGKITKYCVDNTENYRNMVRLLKNSDKDAVVTYIEFDDGTNGFTDECCDLINVKIAGTTTINRAQQSQNKVLQDFRELSNCDKYKECAHYGNIITSTDITTTDGWLSFKIFEIYGGKFLFILISGELINYYELQ